MDSERRRRRFLELAGAVTVLGLAGCSAFQTNGAPATGTGAGDGGGATATVTVGVRADRGKLDQARQRLESELQAGNVTRRQARQELQRLRKDLRADAVQSFTTQASANPDLTVEETLADAGAILVTGTPAALIEALSHESVNALLPKAAFDRVKSRGQAGTATQTPG